MAFVAQAIQIQNIHQLHRKTLITAHTSSTFTTRSLSWMTYRLYVEYFLH